MKPNQIGEFSQRFKLGRQAIFSCFCIHILIRFYASSNRKKNSHEQAKPFAFEIPLNTKCQQVFDGTFAFPLGYMQKSHSLNLIGVFILL